MGLVVIEVKDATIDQIEEIEGWNWYMAPSWYQNAKKGRYETEYPIKQARDQMFALIKMMEEHQEGLLKDDYGKCMVTGNYFCCLPYVNEFEFTQKFGEKMVGRIIFSEKLKGNSLRNLAAMCNLKHKKIDEQFFAEARSAISEPDLSEEYKAPKNKSRMAHLRKARAGYVPIMSHQQETARKCNTRRSSKDQRTSRHRKNYCYGDENRHYCNVTPRMEDSGHIPG